MGRLPRTIDDGLVYHAFNRGNNRAEVFADDADRTAFLEALAKTKDEQAVAPLVQCFAEGTNRFEAEQALKDLGPMAEKQLLLLLGQDQEVFLRLSTIGILKEIGTRESVPALRAVVAEDNVHLKLPAQEAIRTINMRARKNPPK